MPQAEEILADRWALVEKIDEGAMGEIFSARHAVLGHAVAVKVLIPSVSREKAAIERFLREARIAARLQHRNVVRVEDFGVAADGRPFLVMELLRGESLARRLSRAPRPTQAEVLDVVRQIADAVDAAHAAGIVHRDLKPENVFLANEHGATVVKVLDFGVAKFTDTLANAGHATASNTLIGTPRYMSPEQARSLRELDGRSDVWSLGMIAYEMLTGAHPFEGEAIAELLVAILTHRIPPPSTMCPGLPAALDAWAERSLARSRYDRFSTGAELAGALADALAGKLDERWAGFAYERPRGEASRAGTLRVRRPTPVTDAIRSRRPTPDVDAIRSRNFTPVHEPVHEPVSSPLKLTPPEGSAPAVLPPLHPSGPPLAPVPLDVTSEPPQSLPPQAPAAPRASWWLAAAAALVAGLGLVVAIRSTSAPRILARQAAQPVAAALAQEPAAPALTVPPPALPPPPAAPQVVPVQSPVAAQAPVVAQPRGRHRTSRHHRHHGAPHDAASNPPSHGGGLYDPTGI